MKLAGGMIVCESLIREGVDLVFGHPGGTILPLYDHLTHYPQIKHVLARHEEGAALAADAYARATNKVGVCMATSGPGALNLMVGLANAYMDSTPVVAITGQVTRPVIGKDAFQETDVTGVSMPITKHNYLVMHAADVAQTLKEAFHIARTGRPGPVLVDIPRDVQQEMAEYDGYPDSVDLPGYKPVIEGHPTQIKKAAALINGAKRPVIVAGRGVLIAEAENELRALAEKAQIPVITTLLGIGAFPGSHYLNLSLMGMHGSAFANYAVDEADVLINIGSRFDDRIVGRVADFAPQAKKIHVTIDPSSINQNVRVDIPIVGDAKNVILRLLEQVEAAKRQEWLARIEQLRREHPLVVPETEALSTQYVIKTLHEVTQGKALIVTGVGQHQMWAAQFYPVDEPRTFITSGGLGTMGYEVPGALGAQLARPDKLVWSICGDGGFQMTLNILANIRDEKAPVKFAIMENTYLGMVRQWQELFYGRRYSAVNVRGPDFVKLAEAYDMLGLRVTKQSDVAEAIREANKHPGAVLVDFVVEQEGNVYPMIPSGQSVKEMMEGPQNRTQAVSR